MSDKHSTHKKDVASLRKNITRPIVVLFLLTLTLTTQTIEAEQNQSTKLKPNRSSQETALPFNIDGPPPPTPPNVITRDASGRATLRAVRIETPLEIDGILNENIYKNLPAISDFIQNDPTEGAPATEKTDVWLLFDDDNVYVVARCWESRPERIVATEMRRDNMRIVRDDNFAWLFDTFYDRRNGMLFEVSAIGGRIDLQMTNESQVNMDWNPVWDVKVAKFEEGWVMEASLPFKSLRYQPGTNQVWGFQARRVSRWKNESSYITPLSAAQGMRGHFRASMAPTLVGIQAPSGSMNLEIKPYVISNLTTTTNHKQALLTNFSGDLGVDVKYGITQNLTADLTYNPDFAQVEADEQQINLTRFSLFFPEKREFFLENQGIFSFGGVATSGPRAGATDTPVLFYSRRIGLSSGRAVPLKTGGRLTGRLGNFSIGLLNIQSDKELDSVAQATNFSVVRIKRDLLRRSSIGLILTNRSIREQGTGTNLAYGIDGSFGFFDNLTIQTHWAQTRTNGMQNNNTSYRAQLDYAGDRYGLQLEHLLVGNDFNPELGFIRRRDMRKSFGQFRFSPRPVSIAIVRRFSWIGSFTYIQNRLGQVETRNSDGEFAIEFENSDRFALGYTQLFEFLPNLFSITQDIILPIGDYSFRSIRAGFDFGTQRRLSGNVLIEHGTFFNGQKSSISIRQGRLSVTNQISLEPSYSINWASLVEGSFTTHLLSTRATYTVSPIMFASAFLQYNSTINTIAANVRFRWEYQPGSELFIVFNEQRNTYLTRFPNLTNRTFVVKINKLFRF